jgi:DNA-binding transcriptional LysR family regulator
MDKLTSMGVFARVSQAGSFAKAAAELGLSRAMVTKHIAHLEACLGARLLNRTTRSLSHTEAGAAYRERCMEILADIEEAETAITQLNSEPKGLLRMTAPPAFGISHLAPAVADFLHSYREVSINITLSDRQVDLAEEGLDLAIRIGKLPDSNMIAKTLASSRLVVCAAPSYFAEHGIPQHPRELKHHNCLRFTYWEIQHDWQFSSTAEGPLPMRVDGRLESNLGDFLRVIAISGLGIVLQPSYIVGEDIKAGRLQPILLDFEPAPLEIKAVYLHRKHLSAKVRTFVDFLKQRFEPLPYWEQW